jgi:hypothetical protein
MSRLSLLFNLPAMFAIQQSHSETNYDLFFIRYIRIVIEISMVENSQKRTVKLVSGEMDPGKSGINQETSLLQRGA